MQTRSLSSSPHANEGLPLPLISPGKKSTKATTSKKVSEPKCEWSADEEERLIHFLISQIASAADGGNFKQVTWTAAATEMAKVPTKGPDKTSKACAAKYGRVSSILFKYVHHYDTTDYWLASCTVQTSQHSQGVVRAWRAIYIGTWNEHWCRRATGLE